MYNHTRVHRNLLFVVLLVLLVSCTKDAEENTISEQPEAVSAATDYTQVVSMAVPIEEMRLRDRVVGSGVVQGQHEVSIKARTSGEIRSVSVQLGSTLEPGSVLLELDDTIAKLSAKQLENQYENSTKELAVHEQLYTKGAISLSQLNLSRSQVDGLGAQLENAKNNLSNTRIVSPISGSIAQMTTLVAGDFLQAGTQIARVVDVEHLRVVLAVGQSQLFLIKEGAKAIVSIETPTETIEAEGTVRAISADSDEKTGSWTVYVDFENPRLDILRAGVTAEVTIFNEDDPLRTVVPNQAIVYRGESTSVFIAEGSTAKQVEVVIVDQYGDLTAIESIDPSQALKGKRVLVSSLSRLVDGTAINSMQQ